jgi:hypothetical protein
VPGRPGTDRDDRLGQRTEAGQRLGDLRLAAQRRRGGGVGQHQRRVDRVGPSAADRGGAAAELDGPGVALGMGQGAGALDHRARREPGERGAGGGDRAAPGQAEHVAVGDDLGEQVGGDLGQMLAQRRLGLRWRVDHDRAGQAQGVAQLHRQLPVDAAGQPDVHPHQPVLARLVQDPRHLEPADAELRGDVHLGGAVDIEPARDRGGQHELGRSHVLGHRLTRPSRSVADRSRRRTS